MWQESLVCKKNARICLIALVNEIIVIYFYMVSHIYNANQLTQQKVMPLVFIISDTSQISQTLTLQEKLFTYEKSF